MPMAAKAAIALLLAAGLAVLFMRSLDDARAEPFLVRPQHLEGWTLASNPAAQGEQWRVGLTPPPEMPMRLFRQTFSRAGESLSTPLQPGIGLVLADELAGSTLSPDDLMTLARESGIDRAAIRPRCMGYRRESQPGSVRQLYFLIFDMPEFHAFRTALAARVAEAGGTSLRADALSPVMLLAGQPDVSRWMPIVVQDNDCLAPIDLETP
ncbi:MAG: hypothetical protein IT178_14010 [Acidobacteria bacterium]|nr:hypothetical protein [Acidobacteriota bacterium]